MVIELVSFIYNRRRDRKNHPEANWSIMNTRDYLYIQVHMKTKKITTITSLSTFL